ncbi:MAG: hypothetical protein JJE25_09930 [Bacteroidia bacterium]|nr:hypothetical protein [Bacteroidia bacterium]
MIRILEISWFVLGIVALGLGLYKIFSDGISEAVFYGVVMLVSTGMYVIRRKQRVKIEKEN